jgi:hypothetical protein
MPVSTSITLNLRGVHQVLLPTCALQESVKVMAKSLVRNRHAITKMYQLKSQLQAVSLRMAVSCAPVSSPVSLSYHVQSQSGCDIARAESRQMAG